MKWFLLPLLLLFARAGLAAEFELTPRLEGDRLILALSLPADGYLYAEQLSLELPPGGTALRSGGLQPRDSDDGSIFAENGDVVYTLAGVTPPFTLTVHYQGCVKGLCYLPESRPFTLTAEAAVATAAVRTVPADARAAAWLALAERFELRQRGAGYMNKEEFLRWLTASAPAPGEEPGADNLLARVFSRYGLLLAALLILPLGFLLNLTPCVLPMIPINLAIIGAGAGAGGSPRRGLWLGSIYGTAMAIVYGVLGVVVVLTGSRFGAINSSWLFNLAIAVVFVLLALAMFDVFLIDLSRFRRTGGSSGHAGWWQAALLGGMSALLAGACVAPVLIWVLLLSADLYAQGHWHGVLLPFLLGLGMALPWPLLGAGFSRLPKPGIWMVRVKQAFGVLILCFAVYYAWLGVSLLRHRSSAVLPGWQSDLTAAMQQALQEEKPLLIDFWGIACKSCAAMKKNTLPEPEVQEALRPYVKVAFLADDNRDPLIKAALDRYRIVGFPTYLVLEPK